MKISFLKRFYPGFSDLEDRNYSTERNSGIDVFRGIFAVWVLMAHLLPWAIISGQEGTMLEALKAFWGGFSYGFQSFGALNPAVLGFVVLSGYCIHRNGLRDTSSDILPYFYKRFFRIIPVFILATLVGITLLVLHGDNNLVFRLTGNQHLNISAIISRLTGITVFYPVQYPAIFQGNAPLNTVMVELWLYITYPALILIFRKFGARFLSILIFSIFVFGILIAVIENQPYWFQTASIYKFLPYWWVGVFFTTLPNNQLYKKTIFLCIVLYVLAFIFNIKSVIFVETLHFGMALLFGFLFRSLEGKTFNSIFVSVFGFIGKSGYSLYAFHAPIVIYCLFLEIDWRLIILIAMGISFLLYLAIEKPFIKIGYRFTKNIKT